MYSMRPIYNSSSPVKSSDCETDTSKMDLFSRQEHLITNLEQSIRRVDELLKEAKVDLQTSARSSDPSPAVPSNDTSPLPKLNVTWPENLSYPVDIVVQVDPTRLPVTPWALQRLLGKDFVMVRTHIHSTYKGPVPRVDNDNANTSRMNTSVKIIFTIIFRNVKQLEFMVDPVAQTAVAGEANLLRYICRVFPIFPTVGVFEETCSDHFVDLICTHLINSKSKERQTALKVIDEQIAKKGGRFICDKVTLADFCLVAFLQKTGSRDAPNHVQNLEKSLAF